MEFSTLVQLLQHKSLRLQSSFSLADELSEGNPPLPLQSESCSSPWIDILHIFFAAIFIIELVMQFPNIVCNKTKISNFVSTRFDAILLTFLFKISFGHMEQLTIVRPLTPSF